MINPIYSPFQDALSLVPSRTFNRKIPTSDNCCSYLSLNGIIYVYINSYTHINYFIYLVFINFHKVSLMGMNWIPNRFLICWILICWCAVMRMKVSKLWICLHLFGKIFWLINNIKSLFGEPPTVACGVLGQKDNFWSMLFKYWFKNRSIPLDPPIHCVLSKIMADLIAT